MAPNSTSLCSAELVLGEFSDRHQRAVDADRADGCVEARAVQHARVDHRLQFVDPAADGGDDLVDDSKEMRLVLERDVDLLQLAALFDKAVLVAVDQDVVDVRIFQQRLQRAEADHLVDDVVDQRVKLGDVDRHPLLARLFRHEFMHLAAHLVLGQSFQRDKVDLLEQHPVDTHARVEHLVDILGRRGFRLRRQRLAVGNDDGLMRDRRCSAGVAGARRGSAGWRNGWSSGLPLQQFLAEREQRPRFLGAATASSGRMIFFRSLMTLAFGSISCSGTPRSTASRTSR